MDIILDILRALWQSDYETLANPSLAWVIYILLFVIIFLENGLLPAAFLPGDSLLVLVGVLISKDAMSFPVTLTVLTIAASTGCWLGYVQGKFLGNTKIGFPIFLCTIISVLMSCFIVMVCMRY